MRRLKQFAVIAAAVPAVAVMVSFMPEGRAIAQAVRAALVQNVDEPARNPYSESAGCDSYGFTAVFSPVPAGKRLVVTFVNGELGDFGALALGGHGQEGARGFPIIGGFVNSPTVVYYDAGERPNVNGSGSSFIRAKLSGYYVTLP
jgi:hypothetical protein